MTGDDASEPKANIASAPLPFSYSKMAASFESTPVGVAEPAATILVGFPSKNCTNEIGYTPKSKRAPPASSGAYKRCLGSKGKIEIQRQFYRPSDFTVFYNDGSTFEYVSKTHENHEGGRDGLFGMHFEAAEVQRCLLEGKVESSVMPWEDTLSVMKIMDEIRRQLDFKYEGETL